MKEIQELMDNVIDLCEKKGIKIKLNCHFKKENLIVNYFCNTIPKKE